jgi:hypothetical protein
MTLDMLFVGPNLYGLIYLSNLWYSVPLVRVKIELSSLAPEHVIKPGELRFPIGLPVDWKSPIKRLHSNQADQLSLIE